MMPFDAVFPDVAQNEARVIHAFGHDELPQRRLRFSRALLQPVEAQRHYEIGMSIGAFSREKEAFRCANTRALPITPHAEQSFDALDAEDLPEPPHTGSRLRARE
jgi:hypothetical protein